MKYILIILTLILTFSCKVKAQKTEFSINCNEITMEDSEYSDVVITKTCKFKNHLFISIGTPDYKGRYSYGYELLRLEKTDSLKITNSDFFNENVKELEKIINDKLKIEYETNFNISEIKDCMEMIEFRYYNLNEFGISFNYLKQMTFSIDYGIASACFNVNGSSIIMDYYELESYFK